MDISITIKSDRASGCAPRDVRFSPRSHPRNIERRRPQIASSSSIDAAPKSTDSLNRRQREGQPARGGETLDEARYVRGARVAALAPLEARFANFLEPHCPDRMHAAFRVGSHWRRSCSTGGIVEITEQRRHGSIGSRPPQLPEDEPDPSPPEVDEPANARKPPKRDPAPPKDPPMEPPGPGKDPPHVDPVRRDME